MTIWLQWLHLQIQKRTALLPELNVAIQWLQNKIIKTHRGSWNIIFFKQALWLTSVNMVISEWDSCHQVNQTVCNNKDRWGRHEVNWRVTFQNEKYATWKSWHLLPQNNCCHGGKEIWSIYWCSESSSGPQKDECVWGCKGGGGCVCFAVMFSTLNLLQWLVTNTITGQKEWTGMCSLSENPKLDRKADIQQSSTVHKSLTCKTQPSIC